VADREWNGRSQRQRSGPHRWRGARAVRFAVLAIIMLVFDRMGPPGREPAFLRGSRGRASAGQYGIQALPPEAEEYVDRLMRQRRQ